MLEEGRELVDGAREDAAAAGAALLSAPRGSAPSTSRRPSASLIPFASTLSVTSSPPRSRRPSLAPGAGPQSPAVPTVGGARSRSGSLKAPGKASAIPPSAACVQAFAASLSVPSAQWSSPFACSPLYALTPHELSLLFAAHAAQRGHGHGHGQPGRRSSTPSTQSTQYALQPPAFAALLADFVQAVQARLAQRGLPELAARVSGWVEEDGGVDALAARLFAQLDRAGSGRLEREHFAAFLENFDLAIGERLRREWKRSVVLPRLLALAAV